MKVLADVNKCEGFGTCVVDEPRVFDLDDQGFVKVLLDSPPPEFEFTVRQAVRDCPKQALGLEE